MYRFLCCLFFFIGVGLAAEYPVKSNKCSKNQEYSKCGNNECQNTCRNTKIAEGCTGECIPGCVCKAGYVKTSKGDCVLPKDCPTTCSKPNQIYKECGDDPCKNTCEEPARLAYCSRLAGCFSGCICKDGFLPNAKGDCIPSEKCIKCTKPNEVFTKCGNHICLNTCEEPDLITKCIYEYKPYCAPGCICVEGYLRNWLGKCLPADQCPQCKDPNGFLNTCGNTSALTCKNKDNPPEWPGCQQELAGCDCNPGYAFDDQGICIKVEDCPSCPANEEFKSCGTACPLTCENKDNPPKFCTFNCVTGCFCKAGYVRDTKSGKCELPQNCPAPTCPLNEEYNSCGSECPITCKNKDNPPDCITKCVPGCFCKFGYVRNEDTGKCVLPEKCPLPVCPANEEYLTCGSACSITCENKDNPPTECIEICVQGCFCKNGYIRDNKSDKCVLPKNCPAVPKCKDPNSEYLKCKRCVGSCDERNPACDKSCIPPGCYCKVGYVKKSKTDSTCVKESSCPTPKCGINEVWSDKCPIIQENCSHKTKPVSGTKSGCSCKSGYVREREGGSCILKNKCKKY